MSREAVLRQIRSALAKAGPAAAIDPERTYQIQGTLSSEERVQLFVHRVQDYDARVFPSQAGNLAHDIANILLAAGKKRMVVPDDIPRSWLDPGVEWVIDQQLSYRELETVDGVLTGASLAIAESGTLVLQHGGQNGRRALTLLPDYHLCVLQSSQIVETLPQCFAQLENGAASAITFISGPSATADIEMTRIKGVHGPRFLDILLLS